MSDERFSRQSFLGGDSQSIFERAVVAVVGLGGGGSHVVQQLAHIGFLNYVIYDSDVVEDSNLNRLIGATEQDAADAVPKIDVARRIITGLRPRARVDAFQCRWQESVEPLHRADLIFGCVDGFSGRRELEAFARRSLAPLLDIGMDVHRVGDEPPKMGGQVILSMPGGPCMFCMGFLNERNLAREGERYGAAGGMPQVVWPNAILASTAVGIAVDLLTDWTRSLGGPVYMSYDGNKGTVEPHIRLQYLSRVACPHYPLSMVGDPVMRWSSSTEAKASVR
jgi:hypothetical protein